MLKARALLLAAAAAGSAFANRPDDLISALPGWSAPLPSKQYSGFLDVDGNKKIHYWLMESEVNPETAPLVMWFNGGPPCSALLGAFTELGPFRTSASGELGLNPSRWSQHATLLFIESPLGVGFSYTTQEQGMQHDNMQHNNKTATVSSSASSFASSDSSMSDLYASNDTSTAALNLASLQAFYTAFPEYTGRPLTVAGESYAGIYVPMLAKEIIKSNDALAEQARGQRGAGAVLTSHINLKSIMVGNGAIATGDWYEGWLTGLRADNAFSHGLFSPRLKMQIKSSCTNYTKGHITEECQALLGKMAKETGNLNAYDLRETCIPQGQHQQQQSMLLMGEQQPLVASAASRSGLGEEDPCDLGGTDLSAWMNRADVQRAIHVQSAVPKPVSNSNSTGSNGGGGWVDCGGSFGRPAQYTRIPQDERVSVYPDLIGKIHVLIFNGDQDNCIPYTQDEAWTAGMGLVEMDPWRPWMVDKQVGGYVIAYENNFTFATVKGAGHLCPRYQPERSFAMLTRFLANDPL